MTEQEKPQFRALCAHLEHIGLVEVFQHALHRIVFPGQTHMPVFNLVWAMECSRPEQWKQAVEQVAADLRGVYEDLCRD